MLILSNFTLKCQVPAKFSGFLIEQPQVASLVDSFESFAVVLQSAMEAQAPEHVALGIFGIGLGQVALIMVLDCLHDGNANLLDEVVSLVQGVRHCS